MTARKPTELKRAAGTLRKDRTNQLEPVLSKATPTAPSDLSPLAKSYFKKVCQLLDEMLVLTIADVFVVSMLAKELARNQQMEKELKELGSFTYETTNKIGDKFTRAYPHVAAIADSNRLIIQLLAKCGLTPADRANVNAIPNNNNKNEDDLSIFE